MEMVEILVTKRAAHTLEIFVDTVSAIVVDLLFFSGEYSAFKIKKK